MLNSSQKAKKAINTTRIILPIIAFIIPIAILYSLYPESFDATWKGRTYYFFFLWLLFLETLLNSKELEVPLGKLKSLRTVAFVVALLLPTTYVVLANFYGINAMIIDISGYYGVPFRDWMPISIEFLVLALFFVIMVSLGYGVRRLKYFSISTIFLAAIGAIFTIDNLYPYGNFTPFQMIVPTTTTLAAYVLNLMGYQTSTFTVDSAQYGRLPYLYAENSRGWAAFGIGWPCAGVDSLLIYTIVILLFLNKSTIPLIQRAVYLVIGALITYFINILRIATIFIIQINDGDAARQRFHDYYGQLYSIIWIVSYPLIIIGTRILWARFKNWRAGQQLRVPSQPQLSQPNPALPESSRFRWARRKHLQP